MLTTEDDLKTQDLVDCDSCFSECLLCTKVSWE